MSEYLDQETFDWDSEIESDGQEFITLPEGDYVFTVKDVERKNFSGSDKMPACPMVTVSGEVATAKGPATFRENLFLLKRQEWKLSGFFRCIGMKKHGEKLRMDWSGAIGRKGCAHFKPREYKGSTYNTIDKYIDYDPMKVQGFKETKDDEIPW